MRTQHLLHGLLLWLAGTTAANALTPPFEPLQRRETLVLSQARAFGDFVLVDDADPHLFVGSDERDANHFRHLWSDGFTWHSEILSDEHVHEIEAIELGGIVHLAAVLSTGDGERALHYLRFDPVARTLSRRELAGNTTRKLAITRAPGSGTRPVIVQQQLNGAVIVFDELAATPTRQTLPLLRGNAVGMLDAIGDSDSGLHVLYRHELPSGVDEVRVFRRASSGQNSDTLVDENNVRNVVDGTLALDGAGRVLAAMLDHAGTVSLARSPFAKQPAAHKRGSIGFSGTAGAFDFADDAGGGFATLVTINQIGNVSGLRVPTFTGETQELGSVDARYARALSDIDVASNASGYFLMYREHNRLYFEAPVSPWRTFSLSPGDAMSRARATAVDRAGVPTLVGDAPGLGLRYTRWNAVTRRLATSPLRPASEQYAQTALAFAQDGAMLVLARATPGDDAVLIERAADGSTQRTVLDSDGSTGHWPTLAVTPGGSVFAAWHRADTQEIRTARRAPGGEFVFDTVPGAWTADARPRLAASASGNVFLSAFDAGSQRIDVHLWHENAWQLYWATPEGNAVPPHALAAAADGEPALLYAVRDAFSGRDVPYYRFTARGLGRLVVLAPGDASHRFVSGLELALQHGSASDARALIAQRDPTSSTNEVQFARRVARFDDAPFTQQSLGSIDDTGLREGVGLVIAADTFVSAAQGSLADFYRNAHASAFGDPERVEAAVPVPVSPQEFLPPPKRDAACICIFFPCGEEITPSKASLASLDLSARLRSRFAQSEGGRHVLDLYLEHGVEMAQTMLADPVALAQRIRTYETFAPALSAFVEGRGDEAVMTAAMLDDAREVWKFWAENGSAALRADINAELRRTQDLRQFENKTMDEWFALLRTPAPGEMFGSGFE